MRVKSTTGLHLASLRRSHFRVGELVERVEVTLGLLILVIELRLRASHRACLWANQINYHLQKREPFFGRFFRTLNFAEKLRSCDWISHRCSKGAFVVSLSSTSLKFWEILFKFWTIWWKKQFLAEVCFLSQKLTKLQCKSQKEGAEALKIRKNQGWRRDEFYRSRKMPQIVPTIANIGVDTASKWPRKG